MKKNDLHKFHRIGTGQYVLFSETMATKRSYGINGKLETKTFRVRYRCDLVKTANKDRPWKLEIKDAWRGGIVIMNRHYKTYKSASGYVTRNWC